MSSQTLADACLEAHYEMAAEPEEQMDQVLAHADEMRRQDSGESGYFPPCKILLALLRISVDDVFDDHAVTVPSRALRLLLSAIATSIPFDPDWYARTNPDVEGARLAGDIQSLRQHFAEAGYIEGRLPYGIPFDARFYHGYYKDISETFGLGDKEAMRHHFYTKGYFEGRAGTERMLPEANRWHCLVSG